MASIKSTLNTAKDTVTTPKRWLCPKCQKKTSELIRFNPTIKLVKCSECGKYWKCLRILEKRVSKYVWNISDFNLASEVFNDTLREIQARTFDNRDWFVGDILKGTVGP